jgi:hypothetical protein
MIETYNFIKLKICFAKGSVGKGSSLTSTTVSGNSSPAVNPDKKVKEIALKLVHNTIT